MCYFKNLMIFEINYYAVENFCNFAQNNSIRIDSNIFMSYNFIEKSVMMLQKNSIEVMRMEIKRDYYLNKVQFTRDYTG